MKEGSVMGMTTHGTVLVVLSALLLAPLEVQAEQVTEAWKTAMEDRMRVLEDKLEASEVTIRKQNELLRARPAPDVAQGSELDGFLGGLELGGHITASYVYNFGDPDTNTGQQPLNQFNLNHNTFELDAAKLEIGKPLGGPGSAGFQLDLLFGANNLILCGGSGTNADTNVCVQEAYLSYNWNDIALQFGKWETLLGAELIDSPYNNHISHGVLFTWAIPLVHNGLLVSGSLSEEIGWAAGVVNGFNNVTDYGDNKGILGQVSYDAEPLFVSFQTFIGSEGTRTRSSNGLTVGDNSNFTQIYDLVATYAVGPSTDLWLNLDYGFSEYEPDITGGPFVPDKTTSDPQWFGVAGGIKRVVNQKLTLALRGEYFHDDGGVRVGNTAGVSPSAIGDADVVSATATLGYQLTDNLMARFEYRRNWWDSDPDTAIFTNADHATATDDDQDVGILEVSYTFD
jgi:hypothetical protein